MLFLLACAPRSVSVDSEGAAADSADTGMDDASPYDCGADLNGDGSPDDRVVVNIVEPAAGAVVRVGDALEISGDARGAGDLSWEWTLDGSTVLADASGAFVVPDTTGSLTLNLTVMDSCNTFGHDEIIIAASSGP